MFLAYEILHQNKKRKTTRAVKTAPHINYGKGAILVPHYTFGAVQRPS